MYRIYTAAHKGDSSIKCTVDVSNAIATCEDGNAYRASSYYSLNDLVGLKNLELHDVTIRYQSVIPSLVASAGHDAHVRIHIYDSANMRVTGRLVIG